jgi:spore maturation protein CgeB
MKVVLIDWSSYGNATVEKLFARNGYNFRKVAFSERMTREEQALAREKLGEVLGGFRPDYVFSFNYFPPVAQICDEKKVPYLSWVYDSPHLNLYSYTVPLPCNRIFLFDAGICKEFEGVPTVHHLPLAYLTDPTAAGASSDFESFADISFVGSLYNEPKHRLYDKFDDLPPYAKGYLDGLIHAQKTVYGYNFLEDRLSPDLVIEMEKCYPTDPNSLHAMEPAKLYAQFVLSRQVTALERMEIMEKLGRTASGRKYDLYTNDRTVMIYGLNNKGPLDYYTQMPRVFRDSRINLNITLRSILTGIPLRALDIMGCGGFLLSNYQEELCQYFIPGEELAVYGDQNDLMDKIEYYLTHEKERSEIAEAGGRKVQSDFSLPIRLSQMEEYL